VLNLSTQVIVMRNGRIAGMLDRVEATQERVMQLMAGQNGTTPQQVAENALVS
jgi:ABC-type sugar transport system ATPase subunit